MVFLVSNISIFAGLGKCSYSANYQYIIVLKNKSRGISDWINNDFRNRDLKAMF